MARSLNRLTALQVRNIDAPGMVADGGGLYLRIAASGSKAWVFRYHRRDMGLGGFPAVSLSAARQEAAKARELLAMGEDPIEARRKAGIVVHKGMSFADAAARYFASHEGALSAETARNWRARLRLHVLPAIGRLPVSAIETRHVLDILDPLWRTKVATAASVRSQIENVLDWAKARGLRAGENPARWRGHLAHTLPKKTKVRKTVHLPALAYGALPALMTALRADGSIGAMALQFQILTAARPGEVLGARWDEIEGDLWTVPAARAKMRREHRVPLSRAAVALLADLPRLSPYLFPGIKPGRPIVRTTLRKPMRLAGGDVTAHGFRTSFRTWAAECTSFPREVAEMALSHSVGNAVERSYARTDLFEKRRALMEAWANFCARPARDAKVIHMHSGKTVFLETA